MLMMPINFFRGEGEKHKKNLHQSTKNQQSALINVWRMSGIDAKRFLVENISFLPLLTTEKIKVLSDTRKFTEGKATKKEL
jgi:hypothetical protein